MIRNPAEILGRRKTDGEEPAVSASRAVSEIAENLAVLYEFFSDDPEKRALIESAWDDCAVLNLFVDNRIANIV